MTRFDSHVILRGPRKEPISGKPEIGARAPQDDETEAVRPPESPRVRPTPAAAVIRRVGNGAFALKPHRKH
jgi:hypothetical protein